jgi:hypothetical protein
VHAMRTLHRDEADGRGGTDLMNVRNAGRMRRALT